MADVKTVNKKDQILMQLAHYFITVENYSPIMVRGVQNEIWLENLDAPYRIIRINTNYIHNNEQLNYDFLKIKNIVRQVKKKTLSFNVKTLNILIDVGTNVEVKDTEKIDCISIDSGKGITKSNKINEIFPTIKENLIKPKDDLEFIINVTNDINKKTEKENIEFERVFKKKTTSVTYVLIAINIILFLLGLIGQSTGSLELFDRFALHRFYVQKGEVYRLITSAFLHQNLFHLFTNMYALYVIGTQVETYLGKKKFTIIYLFSAIIGSMLSCLINNSWSLGASGAIFGLMGCLLYFGYHYRLYLDRVLKTQIIPIIILNLALGFILPNIDNSAHIGGLIGGILSTMALGINEGKRNKTDQTNGIICSIILLAFLAYMLFYA